MLAARFDDVWRQLQNAVTQRFNPLRQMILCTASEAGGEGRLVVLRGIDLPCGSLWFFTDMRAPKAAQMQRRPGVTALFWDEAQKLQVRARGVARHTTEGARVDELWAQQKPHARTLYSSAATPSQAVADPAAGHVAATAMARQHFGVIDIAVHQLDVLWLAQQRRACATRTAQGWDYTWLCP